MSSNDPVFEPGFSSDEIPLSAYEPPFDDLDTHTQPLETLPEASSGQTSEPMPFDIDEVPLPGIPTVPPSGGTSSEKNPTKTSPEVLAEMVPDHDTPSGYAQKSGDEPGLLISLLRSLDGQTAKSALGILLRVEALLKSEFKKGRHPMLELVEVLRHLATADPDGIFDYDAYSFRYFSKKVQGQVAELKALPVPSESASVILTHMEQSAARNAQRNYASQLISVIDRNGSPEEAADLIKRLSSSTAAASAAPEYEGILRSARAWQEHASQRQGMLDHLRLSSGWPHLDRSQTAPGEIPGFISPGHLAGFVAPSGHGKSSFVRELLRNFALDLYNWGMPNAKVMAIIVEEEPKRVYRAARLDDPRYREIADQVLIAQVNSSRRRFGAAFMQAVVDAQRDSDAAGLPIREFMPAVVLLDYLQEIVEAGEAAYTDAINRTTSLLRGIAECNIDEIEKFSDVRWSEVAPSGMRWPSGLDDHRVAVIATAQVKGLDESTLYWKENSRLSKDDFALRDPSSGEFLWEPRPGDHRIVRRGDVSGSKKFLDNLSTLVFLHRSNPRAGTEEYDRVMPDGSVRKSFKSVDTRARFIFEKMRYGASAPVIPMAFSSQIDGRAAKWFDYRAEAEAIAEVVNGRKTARAWDWELDTTWYDPYNDDPPLLPRRPQRSLASKIAY